MQLSVITDEISMDLAYALDVAKEYDCSAAELRSVWGNNISDLSDAQVDEVKSILDKKEMTVSCLASPLFKCDLFDMNEAVTGNLHQAERRTIDQQMDVLKRCTKLAGMLGTKYIRMFSFWKQGYLTPQVEEAIAGSIKDAVKYAEDNGIVLLMENEHDCYLGTGVEVARFLDRIKSPALMAIWDPGNAFFADEMPFPDGYMAVRNYIKHVHVKDAELLASGRKRFVVIGDGEIDYKSQFAALRADGYEGFLSLETHYRPYAGTAEQASRLCLQSLNKLMSDCLTT